jgi:hypothetical protein
MTSGEDIELLGATEADQDFIAHARHDIPLLLAKIDRLMAPVEAPATAPIAERRLLFSNKGNSERKPLLIRVFAPRPVDPNSVLFRPDADTASCVVEFIGIPDANPGETYGAESIQALQLAIDIEPVLKRLSKHYDFYFLTGEGYFDE